MARLLLVCVCVAVVAAICAVDVREIPYGIASEQDGEARVFTEATEVVFVRVHPKVIRRQYLDGLVKQADRLIQLALAHGDQEMNLYVERFARIKRSSRRKRNILGDGLRWLTGSATLEDVQTVRDSVVGLDDQLQQQEIAIRDTVACVQMDREEIAAIATKTSELINVMNSQLQGLQNISDALDNLSSVQFELQIKTSLENTLSFLEVYDYEESKYEAMFKYQRDLSEIGHLTESLIPRNKLIRLLNSIHSDLTPEYLYTNFNVRLMALSGDRLGFWVTVPRLSGETYTTWRILTVPFLFDGAVRQVRSELSRVGVGLNSGKVIEVEDCLYTKPKLCPAPVEVESNECVMGILSADVNKLAKCPVELAKSTLDVVRKLGNGDLIVYTEGEVLQERCPKAPIVTRTLAAGTFMVQTRPKCVLSSSNGWRYKALLMRQYSVNMTDVFVLKDLDVKFSFVQPTPVPARPPINMDDISELIVQHQAKLPDLTKLKHVQIYNVAGSTIGIGGTLVAVLLLVVAMKWWCTRWLAKRAARSKAVIQPTTTEAAPRPSAPVVEYAVKQPEPGAAVAPDAQAIPTTAKLYLPLPEMVLPPTSLKKVT